MSQNFIKLNTRTEEYHINPMMITMIKKDKQTDFATVYTFDGKMIRPSETFEEIMKLIKKSSEFKFEM
jgi:hypothetical protein